MTKHHDEWPITFNRTDRRRFASLLYKSLDRAGIRTTGEIPNLQTDDGAIIDLRNLLDECAAIPAASWSACIDEWLHTLDASRRVVAEADTMSREIAEASLRIRLLSATAMPDFMIAKPSLPGIAATLFVARPGFGHNVKADMLERWGMELDEAFERARSNTLRRERVALKYHEDFVTLEGPSNYASSHVLTLGDDDQAEDFTPIIVGIPTRNCVVVSALDQAGHAVAKVLAHTFVRYQKGPGPTLPRAWLVERETFGCWGVGAEPIDASIEPVGGGDFRYRIGMGPRLQAYLDSFRSAA